MRRLSPAVLAGLLLGVLGWSVCALAWVQPASADDEIPPPAYPSGLPDPGDIGNEVPDGGYTPGPTIVITPSSTGTVLPRPTDGATAPPGVPATEAPSPGATATVGSAGPGGAVAPGTTPRSAAPVVDGGSPVWLAVAAGLIVVLGLAITFGGIVRERVTRDPASR